MKPKFEVGDVVQEKASQIEMTVIAYYENLNDTVYLLEDKKGDRYKLSESCLESFEPEEPKKQTFTREEFNKAVLKVFAFNSVRNLIDVKEIEKLSEIVGGASILIDAVSTVLFGPDEYYDD